jgi:ABC-2 type transport system permease protein
MSSAASSLPLEPRRAGVSATRSLSALFALFVLSIRQQARARRMLVLGFLFAIPIVIAAITRISDPNMRRMDVEIEFPLIFILIPHVLLPLAALLYACGMVQDEVEDQTLTYLLVRPLWKPGIYLTKLLATLLVTFGLTTVFTILTFVAIYAQTNMVGTVFPTRVWMTCALLGLALLGYDAIFGFLGLVVKRPLVIGIAYIVVLEGIVASIDFIARRATVMYYFRVLAVRWLKVDNSEWGIDLANAPEPATCVLVVAAAAIAATALGALVFATREFRMKTTPEN